MRIRLIRQDLNAPPGTAHEGIEKRAGGVLFWRVGTVIDVDRRAVQLLVGNGDAEPADDESEAAVPNWRQGRERVLLAREMLARGIDPDDRERFKRGELLGYNADGSEILSRRPASAKYLCLFHLDTSNPMPFILSVFINIKFFSNSVDI